MTSQYKDITGAELIALSAPVKFLYVWALYVYIKYTRSQINEI